MPFRGHVDGRYYLKENAGVTDYVRKGLLTLGQRQFEVNGYKEGRLPFGL